MKKMKLFFTTFISILIVMGFTGCNVDQKAQQTGTRRQLRNEIDLLEKIKERGSIIVSTDPNYAPQSYVNEDGEFAGFDIDVAREIGKRLGVTIDFVTPDWDLITAGSWSDRWDMSVGSVAVTEQRKERLDFAEPAYYYTLAQFAATKSLGLKTINDISGQNVCVCTETVYEYWLTGEKERLGLPENSVFVDPPDNIKVMPMKTDNECVQSIQSGREEFAIFLSAHTIVDAAIDNGVAVEKVGNPVFSEHLAVAFDKKSSADNTSLRKKVSQIISQMHEDGTLSNLSRQHFDGRDYTKQQSGS